MRPSAKASRSYMARYSRRVGMRNAITDKEIGIGQSRNQRRLIRKAIRKALTKRGA